MLFGRTQHNERSSLIVLLESGTVRVGVVLHTPGAKPVLLYEVVKEFKTGSGSTRVIARRLLSSVEEACAEITKKALPHIMSRRVSRGAFDTIRYIYGAPWYISRGRRVVVETARPTTYTTKLLGDLV